MNTITNCKAEIRDFDRNSVDESVAKIDKVHMEKLLDNADRGLRMEIYITLGNPLSSYPLRTDDPFETAQALIDKYRSDKPTLSQVYVYLCNYNEKELDGLAFDQLKRFFELFRKNGIRMLLRFAYSTEAVTDASYEYVNRHLEQIGEFFRENRQLIDDTLYCLQFGVVGYWGECHSYQHFDYKKHIKDAIADVYRILPDYTYMQVRTMNVYQETAEYMRPRIGMHDDYIIDDLTDKWAFLPNTDPGYEAAMKIFANTINDGEMPWGNALLGDLADGEPLDHMDGRVIMRRIFENSLTSLSLEHNYREDRENNGRRYTMEKWKNDFVTYEEACGLGISLNPYLCELTGDKLSVFDAVRYHLGYHLLLSNYDQEGANLTFSITNFGFAAPLNFNTLSVVTEDGAEYKLECYVKEQLQSGKTAVFRVTLPEGEKAVGVCLRRYDDSSLTVRFANGTAYRDGVQYFA